MDFWGKWGILMKIVSFFRKPEKTVFFDVHNICTINVQHSSTAVCNMYIKCTCNVKNMVFWCFLMFFHNMWNFDVFEKTQNPEKWPFWHKNDTYTGNVFINEFSLKTLKKLRGFWGKWSFLTKNGHFSRK